MLIKLIINPKSHGEATGLYLGNRFYLLICVCREKRRMELERELFAYSRSDRRISQIKCSKLHSYLKEICDREARAKMRNLELLRDVECIEISMKEYSPDHGPLQQQKVEAVHRRYQNTSLTHPAKDCTQPPEEICMVHQTSRGSDAEAGTTSVHSHQALHRSPNRSMHSRERLPSGLLKDFRVGGEHAASNRAHLSDDISDSNDSPDGCNLSDKHERTKGLLPSVSALTGAAGNVAFGGDDEQEASPLVTLTGPEKNPSPSSGSPMRAKNSLAEHTDSQELTALYILCSLCDDGAGLNDEDLEACGAVVLHELQRLSWSTEKGCLLPQDLVSAHQSSTEPNEISTSLPPNAARLWDRWFKHALVLKERRVLSTERLVQLFTPLLLERHATYSHQVASKAHALPRHTHAHKQKVTHLHHSVPKLETWVLSKYLTVTLCVSVCMFVCVCVRIETKAYQLLKQSAMQERLQSSEEEEEEEEEDGLSGKRCSPLHQPMKYCVLFSLPLCIAFWEESDDSNSDIEAALRPRPFNTNSEDTDDFYD
uniref:Centrosomal protein kizuna n=1 Tax=Amphiprion ocellaris TaxID=80972 RepID=A0AAQ6AA23_AMPOC